MEEAVKISKRVSSKNRGLVDAVDGKLKELAALGIIPTQLGEDGKDFYVQVGDASLIEHRRRFNAQRAAIDYYHRTTKTVPHVEPSEEDYKYIKLLTDLQELVQYDKTVQSVFDISDIEQAEKLNDMYPEFYQRRVEFVNKVAELQLSYAMLMMDGIQTREDLELVGCMFLLNDLGLHIGDIMNYPVHLLVYKKDFIRGDKMPQFFEETMPMYIPRAMDQVAQSLPSRVNAGKSDSFYTNNMLRALVYGWWESNWPLDDGYNSDYAAYTTYIQGEVKSRLPEWATLPKIRGLLKTAGVGPTTRQFRPDISAAHREPPGGMESIYRTPGINTKKFMEFSV